MTEDETFIDPLITYTFIEHFKNEKFICKLNPRMVIKILNVDENRNVVYEVDGRKYTLNILAFIGLFTPLNFEFVKELENML